MLFSLRARRPRVLGGAGDHLGACTNHAHDPRTPELDDDSAEIITLIDEISIAVKEATSAICRRDVGSACQAVDRIRGMLGSDAAIVAALQAAIPHLPAHLASRASSALEQAA